MLDQKEVELILAMVSTCAEEQEDQLMGRKFIKKLLKLVQESTESLEVPHYTVVVALWVILGTLAEEWERGKQQKG